MELFSTLVICVVDLVILRRRRRVGASLSNQRLIVAGLNIVRTLSSLSGFLPREFAARAAFLMSSLNLLPLLPRAGARDS